MRKPLLLTLVLVVAVLMGAVGTQILNAQQASVKRTVLLKGDIAGLAGRDGNIVEAVIPPGSQSGWHHHPGEEFIYIVEGEGVYEIKGRAPLPLKPGVVAHYDEGVVHNAKNTGTTPLKVLGFLILEKGKPLATPDNPPQ